MSSLPQPYPRPPRRATLADMCHSLSMTGNSRDSALSGEAVVAFGPDMRVASWNAAAEQLTGVEAAEAIGQPCWLMLRGHSAQGAVLCHRGCSLARNALAGFGIPRQDMTIWTKVGMQSVSVSTIVVRDRPEPLLVHLIQPGIVGAGQSPAPETSVRLTPRQRQVLHLLAEGVTAHGIAERLGVAQTTVRNHIRAILSELGAHSQIEAVARAREHGLV
ncbi:MAG: LuxR C-terminal-related transcriptional regulator [Gaiellaceae bacterium]